MNTGRLREFSLMSGLLVMIVIAVAWASQPSGFGSLLSTFAALFSMVGILILAGIFIIGVGTYLRDRRIIAGGAALLVFSALTSFPLASALTTVGTITGKLWVSLVLAFVGLSLFVLGLWRATKATITGVAFLLLAALLQLDYTLVIPAITQFFSGSTWFTPSVALLISGAVLVLAGQFLLHSRNLMFVGVVLFTLGLVAKTAWSFPQVGNLGLIDLVPAIKQWLIQDYNFVILLVAVAIMYGGLSHLKHGGGGGARVLFNLSIVAAILFLFMGPEKFLKGTENLADLWVNLTEKAKTWSSAKEDIGPVPVDPFADPIEHHDAQPVPGMTLNYSFKTLVTNEWQDVIIPPGTCVNADPIDLIEYKKIRRDLTEIKSATGQDEYIFLTWMKADTCS